MASTKLELSLAATTTNLSSVLTFFLSEHALQYYRHRSFGTQLSEPEPTLEERYDIPGIVSVSRIFDLYLNVALPYHAASMEHSVTGWLNGEPRTKCRGSR